MLMSYSFRCSTRMVSRCAMLTTHLKNVKEIVTGNIYYFYQHSPIRMTLPLVTSMGILAKSEYSIQLSKNKTRVYLYQMRNGQLRNVILLICTQSRCDIAVYKSTTLGKSNFFGRNGNSVELLTLSTIISISAKKVVRRTLSNETVLMSTDSIYKNPLLLRA